MAGALAQPLGGDLTAGSRILVFYETDVVWHTRYLLSLVDRSSWVILTPDGDIYIEDVSDANQDWSAWRVWPIGGPLPFGVDPNMVHKFNPEPNAAALQVLIAEGNQHAQQERARLGLGAPVGGPVVAAPAAAAAPNAGGGGPAGQAPAPVADLAGGGGGNAQLAAALQAPALGGGVVDPPGEDARTLAISRDVDGNRFKEFRNAVQDAKPCEFSDWPIAGPRTTKYVISQMLDHGGSPLGHHQAWRVACKLQPSDGPAQEHEAWSRVLQAMMTYDQLDVSNLASAELVVWALQKIEERHKHKLVSADDGGEAALFMGSSGGSRAGCIISPKLTEWVGSELQKEALVAKERRKAREERALSRKNADKEDKGGK